MTKLVWFIGVKNFLGQTLCGYLETLLDDGFDRLKMALHPIVVCYKESSKLAEKLFCFNSDDLEHDTEFGIGGTVKRLTARASLQRPYSDQILDVSSMLAFCKTNIPGIQFCYISMERMKEV